MHIVDTEQRHWIMSRMESVRSAPLFGDDHRIGILRRLIKAEGLEKSLGSRYPGTKRFGLEGGESLIPMMSEAIQRIGGYGAKEVVIGMAHRGRLNVLVNILGKNPTELFDEFEGRAAYAGSGDVKYHQGFSSNVMTPGRRASSGACVQPITFGDRFAGGRRISAGPPRPALRPLWRHGGSHRDSRGCGFCRTRRCHGNVPNVANSRL